LPLQGATHVLGSINVLFFTTAMSVETAAERYLPSLSATVARIEERLRVQGLTV
jgi:IclR family mhp operon transcriptional activator